MAVNNSIARRQPMQDKAIEYKVNEETVRLSPSIVKNYLVNGNGAVSDQEVAMFINLCKYQRLNPLIRDAYLIKYGNQPATIVTGKDAILKRAMRNPNYAGHQAGVIVRNRETGTMEHRIGALVLPEEELVGGWAKTFIKGYEVPIESTVSFREYAGTKNNGELNSMWAGKPGVMIRKVALVTSMREAFPEDLGGLYASEEVGVAIDESGMTPIEVDPEPIIEQPEDFPPFDEQQTSMEELPGGF